MKRAALAVAVVLVSALPAAAFDHFNNFNLSGNASPGAPLNTPLTAANSLEATIGYTLDQHDSGMITISIPGSTYVDNAAMITKGVGTVKVRFSTLCTATSPATQTVPSVVLHMWDPAKKEILSAQSPQNVSLTFTCAAGGAGAKPDLVITSFGLSSWGPSCVNGQTVFTFSVGVKNQGGGTWSGPNRPVVVVADMHLSNPDDWGTGMAIDPPLQPGQTRQLSIPVAYFAADPAHMKNGAPHPFHATVNRNHLIPESDFTNNDGPGPVSWNGMNVIQVGVPEACLKGKTMQPGVVVPPGRIGVAPAPTPTLVPIR